jgi:hypothetical protein
VLELLQQCRKISIFVTPDPPSASHRKPAPAVSHLGDVVSN